MLPSEKRIGLTYTPLALPGWSQHFEKPKKSHLFLRDLLEGCFAAAQQQAPSPTMTAASWVKGISSTGGAALTGSMLEQTAHTPAPVSACAPPTDYSHTHCSMCAQSTGALCLQVTFTSTYAASQRGTVAVVDGRRVLLTALGRECVPPPMFSAATEVPHAVQAVAIGDHGPAEVCSSAENLFWLSMFCETVSHPAAEDCPPVKRLSSETRAPARLFSPSLSSIYSI